MGTRIYSFPFTGTCMYSATPIPVYFSHRLEPSAAGVGRTAAFPISTLAMWVLYELSTRYSTWEQTPYQSVLSIGPSLIPPTTQLAPKQNTTDSREIVILIESLTGTPKRFRVAKVQMDYLFSSVRAGSYR